jgi:glutaminyl-tRNA synthetase
VRLKGGYFIKCEDVIKNEDGSIKELLCVYDPETKSGSGKVARKVKGTIHFVDAKTAVPVKVRSYGQLYGEDGEINENSMTEENALAEGSLAGAKTGQRFQFFRKGYYVADEIAGERIFGGIVPLKSSWKG